MPVSDQLPTRLLGATAVAAMLCAATACSSEPDDPLDGVPAFALDAPSITLDSAGENPQLLRYADTDTQPYDATVSVASGINQQAVPVTDTSFDPQAPAGGDVDETTLPLTVTPQPAPAPGDGETDAARRVLVEAGEAKHSDLARNEDIASAKGFLLGWRAAETGLASTVKMLAPEGSSEEGRQAVEQALLSILSATVVFPDDPVGVGGSWTVEGKLTGNATVVRATTYTVTGIDGNRVTLDVAVHERPVQDTLTIDNQAAGELNGKSLSVENASTTSDGELTVDLTKPLPVAGRVAATTRLVYAGADSKFRIAQDVTSAVTYGEE